MNSKYQKKLDNLRITRGRDIPKEFARNVLFSIVELEKTVYKPSLQGNIRRYSEWYEKNPDILTLLSSDSILDVIGSLISMPIDEFAYEKLQSGLWTDLNIESEHVRTYNSPGLYFLCLNTIVIDKSRVRGLIPLKLIIDAFFEKLLELTEKQIIIQHVVTDAVTCEGERLAKSLGMLSIDKKNPAGYSVHTMTLWPPHPIMHRLFFASQIRLMNRYHDLWKKNSQ